MPVLMFIGAFCLVAIAVGWRGRRIGDEPRCAACEFDLTGLFPAVERCPECGAGLAGAGLVVSGARRRRWRLCTVGLVGLAACISLGVLSSRGLLTTQRLVSYLPTGRLIAWSVENPDGPLADECGWELYQRVVAGSVDSQNQQHLLDALVAALDTTDWMALANQSYLLRELATCASTDLPVVEQAAEFLVHRALDRSSSWSSDWSTVLGSLRKSGTVSDADWTQLVKAECTPRVWAYPKGGVAPGQEVTLGVDFGQRVRTQEGWYAFEVLLPEGSEFLGWQGMLDGPFKNGSAGLPGQHEGERLRVRAPQETGVHEVTVRVWYSDSEPPLGDRVDESASSVAEYLMAEKRVLLDVSLSATDAPDSEDLGMWISKRVLPAQWGGSSSQGGGYAGYGATVQIADTEGAFSAAGTIEVLVDGKDRHQMGKFTVENTENSTSHSWAGAVGGSSSGGGSGGGPFRASIEFEVDGRYAFRGDRVRYFIVFDELSLPDGRELGEGSAIEVELWPDPLRAGPTGW